MEASPQLGVIIDKSRQHFLAETKGKLDRALYDLMEASIGKISLDCTELRNFFHIVAGTARTLQLSTLYEIAVYYGKYLERKGFELLGPTGYYKLLTGLARINDELKGLAQKYLITPMVPAPETISTGDYTTLPHTASILIVDDDVLLLSMLDRVFCMEGYYVIITPNSEEVPNILAKKSVDLIILDIIMPTADGFHVFKQVRGEFPDIPVIFLTAKAYKGDRIKAFKSGVDDYIAKPFETDELLARVESIILRTTRNKQFIITDMLTGVYAKKFFNDDFKEFKARFTRKSEKFSVAFIDLDYFKDINDTYGHLIGDNVLKDFVKHLRDCLRITDHIFRFGGDEFLILMPDTEAKVAFTVVERIRAKLHKKDFIYEGMKEPIKLSFSSGIAQYLDPSEGPEKLLERADKALYISKNMGKNRTHIFSEYAHETLSRKKIFVIDDNDVIVRLIKTRLISLGYDAEYATDGNKVVEFINSYRPDIIIIDIMLSDIDSYEVCKRAREILKNKNMKLIVLSAIESKCILDMYTELEVDEFVAKPFSLAELEGAIQRLLR